MSEPRFVNESMERALCAVCGAPSTFIESRLAFCDADSGTLEPVLQRLLEQELKNLAAKGGHDLLSARRLYGDQVAERVRAEYALLLGRSRQSEIPVMLSPGNQPDGDAVQKQGNLL